MKCRIKSPLSNVAPIFMILFLIGAGTGCATQNPPPPKMPLPASFEISGAIDFELPPALQLETGLPKTMRGSIEVKAHAEVISIDPLTSHQDTTLKMHLTDGEGKQSFANFDIHVIGQCAGSPDEALANGAARIVDAISLTSKGIPHPQTAPSP